MNDILSCLCTDCKMCRSELLYSPLIAVVSGCEGLRRSTNYICSFSFKFKLRWDMYCFIVQFVTILKIVYDWDHKL